jgi:hypothetical protein
VILKEGIVHQSCNYDAENDPNGVIEFAVKVAQAFSKEIEITTIANSFKMLI